MTQPALALESQLPETGTAGPSNDNDAESTAAIARLQELFKKDFESFSALSQAYLPDFMVSGGAE